VLAPGVPKYMLGFRSPGMDSFGDKGDAAPVLAGSASAPAAVGGGSASASGGKPPVKRVMKTPYQLEVLERTYSGSWVSADDSECLRIITAGFLSSSVCDFSLRSDLI
jgi:hypothetical protein